MTKSIAGVEPGQNQGNPWKKILICEMVIALIVLTGFYYSLADSPPVRMPERPISSVPEVIASLSSPTSELKVAVKMAATEVEAVSVGEQMVTIALLPPTEVVTESGADVAVDSESTTGGAAVAGKEDVSEKESASPATVETSVPAPANAVIVAGEYVLHSDLRRNQNRLKALNFKTRTEVVSRLTPISRVFLGPFTERRKALTMMAVTREKGDDPFLLKLDGSYNVVIGSFYLQSSVDDWKKLYCAAGFTPKVQKIIIKMPHSILLLDGVRVQENADTVLLQLHDAGFPDAHLR